MMMLMGDNDGDSMSKLLPLMMMGGQSGLGGMDPLMMMTLLDDDNCEFTDSIKNHATWTDEQKKNVATGKFDASTGLTEAQAADQVDYDYLACDNKKGMDPMMMMLMMDGGSMDDLLPLMMMGGQQPGQAGGMNPLMMMSLLDGDKTKKSCDEEYNVKSIFTAGTGALTADSNIENIRAHFKALATKTANQEKYVKCIDEAKDEGKDKSKLDKLLPLMMMGGMGGQQGGMDAMLPMLMMM